MGTYFAIVWKDGQNQFSYYGSRVEAERYLHRLLLTGQVNAGCRIGLGHKRTQEIYFYGSPNNFLAYLNGVDPQTSNGRNAASLGSRIGSALGSLRLFNF